MIVSKEVPRTGENFENVPSRMAETGLFQTNSTLNDVVIKDFLLTCQKGGCADRGADKKSGKFCQKYSSKSQIVRFA